MSSFSPALLITRPREASQALVGQLQALGADARCLPLFEIFPLQPDLPEGQPDNLVFVSANAVRCSLQILRPLVSLPHVAIHAIGPATASALRAEGFEPRLPSSGFRSEELLAEQGEQLAAGYSWVICGEGGREQIQHWLTERGARFASLYCYRREPVADAARQLAQLAQGWRPDLISLMSVETLELFDAALVAAELEGWRDKTILVPSPRVLARGRELGYRDVLLLQDASESSLLDFVAGLTPR